MGYFTVEVCALGAAFVLCAWGTGLIRDFALASLKPVVHVSGHGPFFNVRQKYGTMIAFPGQKKIAEPGLQH
jgi:hypothetical protein